MAKTVYVTPKVPDSLRQTEPKPDRAVQTAKDLTLLVVDYDEALTRANSKIEATDTILSKFEARVR